MLSTSCSKLICGFVSCSICLAVLFPVQSIASGPQSGTVPPGELRDVMAQFQATTSVRFGAQAELTLSPGAMQGACPIPVPDGSEGIPFAGAYEFKAAGTKYYVASSVDPAFMPWMNTKVAYDDTQYQLLRHDGTLSLSPSDSPTVLPLLPNPLIELLQFRYPLTDANAHVQLRIRDVWTDQVPESFWDVPWTLVQEDGITRERAVFPGGVHDGRAYVHHVVVPATLRRRPLRIDRVSDTGQLITRTEFADYRRLDTSAGPAYWPHRITLKSYDTQAALAGQIDFTISEMAIDESLSAASFAVPPAQAARIWDEIQSQFIPLP